jgi:hypothetical protein
MIENMMVGKLVDASGAICDECKRHVNTGEIVGLVGEELIYCKKCVKGLVDLYMWLTEEKKKWDMLNILRGFVYYN